MTAAFTGGGEVIEGMGFRGFDVFNHGILDDNFNALSRFLNDNNGTKSFIFFHTYHTHDPHIHPYPYDTMYDPDYKGELISPMEDLPLDEYTRSSDYHFIKELFWGKINLSDPRDVELLIALYDGGIKHADYYIGKLFVKLEESGLLNKTIIIITSDHGMQLMEHNMSGHFDVYDEIIHVPIIMWIPSFEGGKRVSSQVSSIDIMPTILELLGMSVDEGIQGNSLIPMIVNDFEEEYPAFSEFSMEFRYNLYEPLQIYAMNFYPLISLENDLYTFNVYVLECLQNISSVECLQLIFPGGQINDSGKGGVSHRYQVDFCGS